MASNHVYSNNITTKVYSVSVHQQHVFPSYHAIDQHVIVVIHHVHVNKIHQLFHLEFLIFIGSLINMKLFLIVQQYVYIYIYSVQFDLILIFRHVKAQIASMF